MFYLEWSLSGWPVQSVKAMDRYTTRPIVITTDKIEDARKFTRRSDALRCKRYWETNESVYSLCPWTNGVKELFVIREYNA